MRSTRPPVKFLHRSRAAALLALLVCLDACAPLSPAPAAAPPVPAHFGEGTAWQSLADPAAPLPQAWWTLFHDPQLDRLEEQALQANQSLIAAGAVHAQAMALVAEREAALLPSLSLTARAEHARLPSYQTRVGALTSYARGSTGVAANAAWELDVWGQQGSAIDAERAWAASADARRAGVALSIGAQLAEYYFLLRQLDTHIQLTQSLRKATAALEQMAQADLKRGRASRDDALQAQADLDLIDAQLPLLQRDRTRCEHAIALLTGQAASGYALAPQPGYTLPDTAPPTAVPSQLLERRPDIVGARRGMVATGAEQQRAAAAFFPRIVLGASSGRDGSDLERLTHLPVSVWSLGLNIGEQLFDGGARAARLERAKGRVDEQVARYRDTVLTALREVEDGLAAAHFLAERDRAAQRFSSKQDALLESRQRLVKAGLSSRRDVLQARRRALEAKLTWRDGQGETVRNEVGMIKALGGGWQAPAPATAP